MSLPFFYEPAIAVSNGHFQLGEETSRHCIQVLRMKIGEQLQFTNGAGALFKARILREDKKKAVVLIEEELLLPRHFKKIGIAISLLKNPSRFEWFLEKAVEIGVSEIMPLICERTEHTRFRTDRMKQILVSAMLQSQQVWLPVLQEPAPFKNILVSSAYGLKLVAHCEEEQKNNIGQLPPFADAQILIGPEGDFTPQEIRAALSHHFLPVTLGETRLRAETAGIVAATLLVHK
jgi:16S rRNA (uracil1498-N3)-methyltransferase